MTREGGRDMKSIAEYRKSATPHQPVTPKLLFLTELQQAQNGHTSFILFLKLMGL